MSERIFTNEADQLAWEEAQRNATPADRELASLLMTVAFNGDRTAEERRGLRPLYVVQAYYLRRRYRDEMKLLMERSDG